MIDHHRSLENALKGVGSSMIVHDTEAAMQQIARYMMQANLTIPQGIIQTFYDLGLVVDNEGKIVDQNLERTR